MVLQRLYILTKKTIGLLCVCFLSRLANVCVLCPIVPQILVIYFCCKTTFTKHQYSFIFPTKQEIYVKSKYSMHPKHNSSASRAGKSCTRHTLCVRTFFHKLRTFWFRNHTYMSRLHIGVVILIYFQVNIEEWFHIFI